MPGIYNWPLASVGYFIFIRGHKFNRIASLMSVKEPLINAWLAIIAALVAIIIPGNTNHSGIMP